jgi:mannosyltransferase
MGAGATMACRQRWYPALPAIGMLCMSLIGITAPSFWRDEASTLSAVRRPFPLLLQMLGRTDVVHGAYYLLMWPLVRIFGSGELGARLPSAIAMSATAAGLTVLGRRVASARAGLAAGSMFALTPVTSRYAQEARSYAMVMGLAVLASYLLVRALGSHARSTRWLIGYALVLGLTGWMNLLSLLIIPAHGLTVWLAGRPDARSWPGDPAASRGARPRAAGWLAAVGCAGIGVLPLVVLAWPQRDGTARFLARTTLTAVGDMPGRLTGSWPVLAVTAALIGSGLAAGRRLPVSVTRLSLPWLLLPPFALLSAGTITPVYDPRYVLFCAPALALLAGSACDWISELRSPGVVLLVLAVAVAGLPSQLADRSAAGHDDNLRLAASILAARERAGDAVLYSPPWWRQIGSAYPVAFDHLDDIALAKTPVQAGNFTGTQLSVPRTRRKLRAVRRAWLVEFARFRPDLVLAGAGWHLVGRWQAGTILLLLYTKAGANSGDFRAHGRGGSWSSRESGA